MLCNIDIMVTIHVYDVTRYNDNTPEQRDRLGEIWHYYTDLV